MHILHICTDVDSGGAGTSCLRLHKTLLKNGLKSTILVQKKSFQKDNNVIHIGNSKFSRLLNNANPSFDAIFKKIYKKRLNVNFSSNLFPNLNYKVINSLFKPSIVHLHWIGNGFIPINSIRKIKAPIIWTMHDMWAFTGGCHYNDKCLNYYNKCCSCPILGSKAKIDLSTIIQKQKQKNYSIKKLVFIAPSKWIYTEAKKSRLISDSQIKNIANPIDIDIFKPINKIFARKLFNLPINKKVILYGAIDSDIDKRKGYDLLDEIINTYSHTSKDDNFILLTFGGKEYYFKDNSNIVHIGLGKLKDSITLSLVYNCSDIFICPSRQDNLPNTIIEALACGKPCVSFNIGGFPDMIIHKFNGYLAESYNCKDFATGIDWILNTDNENYLKLTRNSIDYVLENYNATKIGNEHIALYKSVLNEQ